MQLAAEVICPYQIRLASTSRVLVLVITAPSKEPRGTYKEGGCCFSHRRGNHIRRAFAREHLNELHGESWAWILARPLIALTGLGY